MLLLTFLFFALSGAWFGLIQAPGWMIIIVLFGPGLAATVLFWITFPNAIRLIAVGKAIVEKRRQEQKPPEGRPFTVQRGGLSLPLQSNDRLPVGKLPYAVIFVSALRPSASSLPCAKASNPDSRTKRCQKAQKSRRNRLLAVTEAE